jgi:hypothetical protein
MLYKVVDDRNTIRGVYKVQNRGEALKAYENWCNDMFRSMSGHDGSPEDLAFFMDGLRAEVAQPSDKPAPDRLYPKVMITLYRWNRRIKILKPFLIIERIIHEIVKR